MARIQPDMAATLSKQLNRVDSGQMLSGDRLTLPEGGGRANAVKDTVTISMQARELAAVTKTAQVKSASMAKVDLGKHVAQVKKATAALQSMPSQRMRYVVATGTVLMPGKTTTVNITG